MRFTSHYNPMHQFIAGEKTVLTNHKLAKEVLDTDFVIKVKTYFNCATSVTQLK